MKMNTKLMLTLTFMLSATSCNDSEVIVEEFNVSNAGTISIPKQLDITPDEVIYKAQSDFENMLMDQVVYRDSAYVLNMSREEAIDLTIPDSLYVL